jgi:hypothetical protein
MGNFWVPMARTEQGDEEANCSARLNKRGYSGFNATAVSEEVVPRKKKQRSNHAEKLRRQGIMMKDTATVFCSTTT